MKWILFLMFAVASASAGTIQKPSELLRTLHTLMNAEELSRTFGVVNSSRVDEYEVIYIRRHKIFHPEDPLQPEQAGPRKRSGPKDNHAHYSFAANGKDYNLKLRPNNFLIAQNMKTVIRNGPTGKEVIHEQLPAVQCHFLHVDGNLAAALSHCSEDDVHGYLIDGGKPSEIRPVPDRLRKMLHLPAAEEEDIVMVGAHILRPVDPLPDFLAHAACGADRPIRMEPQPVVSEPGKENIIEKRAEPGKVNIIEKRKVKTGGKSGDKTSKNSLEKSITPRNSPNKVLELGIFLDAAALGLYMPYLGTGEYVKLRELVLAFVNGMQALYHLPSLGQRLDLSIVYMEFHAKPPANMPGHGGERGKLLDSFCGYQKKLNKPADSDPEHWDMALLLSGLDMYAVEAGKNNYVTMGLSTVTGVCTDIYNCVIGEIGVNNQQGQTYPSTGFTSIYVMAHEIGHNLGMSHDSSGNTCTSEGFIMSPSRGVVGEATWSTCSKQTLASISVTCMNDLPTGNFPDYNHNKYGNSPGQLWTADEQCRLLLRDKAATAFFPATSDLANCCDTLKCKTPNRDGFFYSGPALPGTNCGPSKWCVGGQCVPSGRSIVMKTTKGGWSDWKNKPCSSGCLVNSKGAILGERECDNPKPSDALNRCDGPSVRSSLCDDTQACISKMRMTPAEYAGQQCVNFTQYVTSIDPQATGMQAAYSPSRPWQSCAIFCKRHDRDAFYAPRLELNNLPDVSAYFPDGTWCGNDGQKDLYCLQRSCVSADQADGLSRSSKIKDDIEVSNNALRRGENKLPGALEEYFMLDKNGKPIKEELDNALVRSLYKDNLHGFDDDDFILLKS